MSSMRTGADYRESLRDGRRVFVLGEGLVEDVTDASGDPGDGRGIRRLVRPALRARVAGHAAHAAGQGRQALAGRLHGAAQPPGSRPHGPMLLRHHLPQRRQHHPHAGLRPSDRHGRPDRGQPAQCLARAARQRRGLSRADRPHRPLPHLRRRCRDHRLSPARGSRRAGGAQDRQGNRQGPGDPRQDRHAHQPGLRPRRLYRRPQRRGLQRPSRHLRRRGQRARRHRGLPQARGARWQPVLRPAQRALRRARRPDVARRRADPVGPRLPHRAVRRSGGALAVLASALLLAVQGRVHPGAGARLHACDGARLARRDRRVPGRSDHRRADRAQLPDGGRARSGVHARGLLLAEPSAISPPAALPC